MIQKKKEETQASNQRKEYWGIDIIAREDGVYVFVGVKSRQTDTCGKGFEAVDRRKQEKIRQSALFYCQTYMIEALCRFDVISLDDGELVHIENAF